MEDTTPPEIAAPAAVWVEAAGPQTPVSLAVPAVSDLVDPAPVVTSDAPAEFPLGATVVTWTATDASGNSTTATQLVTVGDTTPPELTVPGDITLTAAGPFGAVVSWTASATDVVDGTVAVICAPPSGSTFPVGATTVTCSATDAHGNAAAATFQVRVQYGFGGFLAPLAAGRVYKAGRTLPVKFRLSFGDGSPAVTAAPTMQLQRLSASEPAGEPMDASSSGSANDGNGFRVSGELYIYNLATRTLSRGYYRIQVDLGDGSGPKTIVIGLR